ncbi:transposase [Dactylosporangium maewongense]|uniref:transposase n=1 Tax=Dactylosporangium maewongense TaxID=634393 RepID=UPI0031D012E8
MAGASSFAAISDWLHDLDEQAKTRLGFGRRVPAGTTMWRLLTRLDAGLLTQVLAGWLRTRTRPALPRPRCYRTVIAVDGKTLRGARRPDGGHVHLLAALDTSTGVVLAQVTIEAKPNEIPASAPLLDAVEAVHGDLTGVVFVADALHTQTRHRSHRPRRAPARTGQSQPADLVRLTSNDFPGPRSRRGTAPATAATAAARPAPSKPSPCIPPAGSRSRTPHRPSGSPTPASPPAGPAAKPPT